MKGAWILSGAPFDKQPYVIVDYKGDDLLNSLSDRVREIGLGEVPKHPGLYIVKPLPQVDDDATENWLWKVWQRERVGLYIDEGYMLPDKGGAFRGILTQGRSKHIPVIALSQRPVWVNRFVFSEADFYSVFHLNDTRDRQTVQSFIPAKTVTAGIDSLEKYHSFWYDVSQNQLFQLSPVPGEDEIRERVHSRLKPPRRFL